MRTSRNRFLLSVFSVALAACLFSRPAHATLSLSLLNDTDLGTTTVAPPKPTSPTNNVSLGTNGSISYATGFSGSGSGTVGRVQITGPSGANVSISCDT